MESRQYTGKETIHLYAVADFFNQKSLTNTISDLMDTKLCSDTLKPQNLAGVVLHNGVGPTIVIHDDLSFCIRRIHIPFAVIPNLPALR